ncbi:hypothetical protein C8K15_12265 [Paenisporosarcina sp. OV554]|nr:hypothetical protein C8K15_12265 [Paenisporosarcina sp. OV554]
MFQDDLQQSGAIAAQGAVAFLLGLDVSFAGTTPNMQLIEELQADRERMKEIQERLKRIEEADQERAKADRERFDRIEEHLKQREQVKKVFFGCAEIGGNWQLAKLKIIWVLTGHCLWAV